MNVEICVQYFEGSVPSILPFKLEYLRKKKDPVNSLLQLESPDNWIKKLQGNERFSYKVKSSLKKKKKRQTPYDITYMQNLNYDTNEFIYKTERDTQT